MLYTDLADNDDYTQIALAQKNTTGTWKFKEWVTFGPGPTRAETGFKMGDKIYACRYTNLNNMGSDLYLKGREDPVLTRTPNWYDNDMIYSPTIIYHNNEYVMIYRGQNWYGSDPTYKKGCILLMATSPDGINWTKKPDPLQYDHKPDWMINEQAEPSLIKIKNRYYLFITGLKGEERILGVAVSDSPFGPWKVNPKPIAKPIYPLQYLAPSAVIEGNKVAVYFVRHNDPYWTIFRIESNMPLYG